MLSVSAWSLSSVLFDWLRVGNHVMFRALIKKSDIYFHTEISFNPWQNIIIEYFSIKKIFIISFLTHKSDLSETILTLWIHFSHPHSQRASISIQIAPNHLSKSRARVAQLLLKWFGAICKGLFISNLVGFWPCLKCIYNDLTLDKLSFSFHHLPMM